MEKNLAKSLMSIALSLGKPINEMFDLVEEISDNEIKKNYKEMIQYLMAYATDIILSVEKIYPELNPDLPDEKLVVRETNPDTGITDYTYDARGLVTQIKDARLVIANMTYDNAGITLTAHETLTCFASAKRLFRLSTARP
ncbi:MAG: hypothetical protein WCC66_13210 [Rhizobiaceae bacterium]